MVYAIAESIRRGDKQQTFPKDNQSQFNKSLIPKGYESLPHNTHYTYLANNHPVHLLLFFKAHIPEHRRHTKDGKTIIVHAHDDKRTAQQPHPETFIKAPDGSFDFGEITPELSKVIKRQAGKIRLQVGIESDKEKYGIAHIETGHKKEIESLGYSVADFVLNATRVPDELRQGNSGSLIMVKKLEGKDNITKLVFVRLKPLKEGDFYCVETAFVKPVAKVAKDYPLLWSASVPHPTDSSYLPPSATASTVKTGEDRSTGTLGQSKDSESIAPSEKNTSPKDLHKAFGTKPNTMILFFKKAA